MWKQLKLVLAGAAALALQGVAASDAKASDEGVPPECLKAGLSPGEQERCDFIARTPNICMWPDLSDRTQRWCDRMRFAGEPRYNMVRLARNGAVRSIHLFETESGRESLRLFPYGLAFGVPTDDTREVRMKTTDLAKFVEGRPGPESARAPLASVANYATGLPIGWTGSAGISQVQCLNYVVEEPSEISGVADVLSFSSANTADSTVEQINVSVTVKGTYDVLSASNSFSLSDTWQTSTNSGTEYFNAYVLRKLGSAVDEESPLNTFGCANTVQGSNCTQPGPQFSVNCGSQYLSAVTVGMVATISIAYGSSSVTTQQKIADSFSVTAELVDSVDTAVNVANTDTESSSYFQLTLSAYGGGTSVSTDLSTAFGNYVDCVTKSTTTQTDCSGPASGLSTAMSDFKDELATLNQQIAQGETPDLGFLETFPGGVAGAPLTDSYSPLPIPVANADDALCQEIEDYQTKIGNNATLLN